MMRLLSKVLFGIALPILTSGPGLHPPLRELAANALAGLPEAAASTAASACAGAASTIVERVVTLAVPLLAGNVDAGAPTAGDRSRGSRVETDHVAGPDSGQPGTLKTAAKSADKDPSSAAATTSTTASTTESTQESKPGPRSSRKAAAAPKSETPAPSAEADSTSEADEGSGDADTEDRRPRRWRHPHMSIDVSNDAAVTFGPTEVNVPVGEANTNDIVSIGGRVTIRGEAHGDVTVIAGVLTISGHVRGDVVAVGSRVYLEDGARIGGSMTSVVGRVQRAPDVHIGDSYTTVDFPMISRFATGHGAFAYLVTILFWATILFTAFRFLAILVIAAVAPVRIDAALSAPRPSWVLAFFIGLLVYVFGHLLVTVFCLLLPLGVAMWIALHVAIWMGLASIYLHVGRSIGRTAFGKNLSYFGAILTGFALFALLGLIPCFGWVLNGMTSMCGLGMMLLTRFGSPNRKPVPPTIAPPPPPPSGGPGPVSTAGGIA